MEDIWIDTSIVAGIAALIALCRPFLEKMEADRRADSNDDQMQ